MAEHPSGAVENVPVLDLMHTTWAEELTSIERITNVGAVLVPDHLAHLLSSVTMENVGAVIPVPAGAHTRVHTGVVMIGGDGLAEECCDKDVLVVTGGLIVTSPVSRVAYREVIVTGLVLGPRGSESVLGAGLTRVTGSVGYYRYVEGQEFTQVAGQSSMSGASLANARGTPDDVLVVAGQLTITSPVKEVGYQRIYYGGQLYLPRVSEDVLIPALSGSGQVVWYGGTNPRFFGGSETFGRGFFELLDGPTALVLSGVVRIAGDVDADLLRRKVSEITLVGHLSAPRELIPVLQVLTVQNYGELSVAAGDSSS